MGNLLSNVVASPSDVALLGGIVLGAALLVTLIVECGVALLFRHGRRLSLVVLFCNLITNIPMNIALVFFVVASGGVRTFWFWAFVLLLEVFVVYVEAILIQRWMKREEYGFKRSLGVSAVLNGASVLAGLVILWVIS